MRSKRLITHISPVQLKQLKEMSIEKGRSVSELIRNAWEQYYLEFQKIKYGRYKGTSVIGKKAEKTKAAEATIKAMEDMSDDELTAYLLEIGYSFPDTDIEKYRMETREFEGKNLRYYRLVYFNYKTGEETGGRDCFDWDELIADLKKNKKL